MSPKKQTNPELLCSHLLCRWHLLSIRIMPKNWDETRKSWSGRVGAQLAEEENAELRQKIASLVAASCLLARSKDHQDPENPELSKKDLTAAPFNPDGDTKEGGEGSGSHWRGHVSIKGGEDFCFPSRLWWEEEAYILARVVPTSLSSCESRGVVQESREPVRALLDPGPSCPAVGSRRSGQWQAVLRASLPPVEPYGNIRWAEVRYD